MQEPSLSPVTVETLWSPLPAAHCGPDLTATASFYFPDSSGWDGMNGTQLQMQKPKAIWEAHSGVAGCEAASPSHSISLAMVPNMAVLFSQLSPRDKTNLQSPRASKLSPRNAKNKSSKLAEKSPRSQGVIISNSQV